MDQVKFGRLFRKTREVSNRTMGQVARHLGVKVAYLSGVELGDRPPLSPTRIRDAAQFMGVDVAPLLQAAAETRGAFEIDAEGASTTARETLAALARESPSMPDDKWVRIRSIVEE
jgi:transcriptional regulator with XRE-family HTH domain